VSDLARLPHRNPETRSWLSEPARYLAGGGREDRYRQCNEQLTERVPASDQTTGSGMWDFSKIPIFPPGGNIQEKAMPLDAAEVAPYKH